METEPPPPSQSPTSFIRYGSWDTTIDLKRRLVLPAEVRNAMDPQRDGSAFFVFIGANEQVWFYPERPFDKIISQNRMGLNPDPVAIDLYQAVFGKAFRRDWDKQGRVILPDQFLNDAKMKVTDTPIEVTLVGTGDHYQLWHTVQWRERSKELDKNRAAIFARARAGGLTLI